MKQNNLTNKKPNVKPNKRPNGTQTNLVQEMYNSISTNYLVSADVTKINAYGQVYIAIDHASRCVIGHAFSTRPFQAETIIEANLKILRDRAFLPPFCIWHTDRESLFTNKAYVQSMENRGVRVSRGAAKAFQSQVIERFNRTFKTRLKTKIADQIHKQTGEVVSVKGPGIFKEQKLTYEQTALLVTEVIQEYNNAKHANLQNMSPNQMEEALFLKHQNRHPERSFVEQQQALQFTINKTNEAQDTPMLTKTGDISHSFAEAYRMQVIAEYKGDWLKFFLDWKQQQEKQGKQVLEAVVSSKEQVIHKLEQKAQREAENAKKLAEQYQSLYEQFLEIQIQTSFLQDAEQQRQQQLKELELKRQKRKAATKQKVRQTITITELHLIVQQCVKSNSPYIKARRTVALFILYLTGLRVQNLLFIDKQQLQQLLNTGHTEISLIKRGPDRHPIRLAHKGKALLQTVKDEIFLITKDKTYDQPAFSPKDNQSKAMDPDTHEKELNQILTRASTILKKHIRTHSFRATLITELLAQGTQIQDVKEIIGHTKLESTLRYDRNKLTVKEIDKLITKRYQNKQPEEQQQQKQEKKAKVKKATKPTKNKV